MAASLEEGHSEDILWVAFLIHNSQRVGERSPKQMKKPLTVSTVSLKKPELEVDLEDKEVKRVLRFDRKVLSVVILVSFLEHLWER